MNGQEFLFFVALLCVRINDSQGATSSFIIEQGGFLCGGNLLCWANATTNEVGLLKLTPDPINRTQNYTLLRYTFGVVLYNQSIQLLNRASNQVASFSISFSFLMEPGQPERAGDGMAFVLSAEKSLTGGAGLGLGVYGRDGLGLVDNVAVEFDTWKNDKIDKDNNHVGIDTTSVKSVKAKSAPFSLTGKRVYAWVEYNSLTSTLAARVDTTAEKPEQPFITYTMDLRDAFEEVEEVWVGFGGSNGNEVSYYTVYDLSLNSSFPAIPTNSSKKSSSTGSSALIAGVTVGAAGAVLGVCLVLCARRKERIRRRLTAADEEEEFQIPGLRHNLKKYSYDELRAATQDFGEAFKLGEGGFGSVYRGSIPGTKPELLVAVKKLNNQSSQGEREFLAEVSTIGMLRHRNIVQLLGWSCRGPGKYLLVYEFMPNGSLNRHLYQSSMEGTESYNVLSWEKRFKILRGLAAALDYLHEGWRQQVLHRDVKSANVMLDDDYNATLGDFGLARMADHYKNPETTVVAGTFGYLAPEASRTGKFTVKTDVYAFGAVCLETVCGRKVFNIGSGSKTTGDILLVDYVWRELSRDKLFSVVDMKLEGHYDLQEVELALRLGLFCSHPLPDERPDMRTVVNILAGSVEMPPIPMTKPEIDYRKSSTRERLRGSLLEIHLPFRGEVYSPAAYNDTHPERGSTFA